MDKSTARVVGLTADQYESLKKAQEKLSAEFGLELNLRQTVAYLIASYLKDKQ